MHKSKLFILAAIALVMAGFTLQSCEDEDSYGERRERERKVIRSFINKGTLIKALDSDDTLIYVAPIKTISEAQFEAQDSTTNLQENEYVLFKSSGVYMQIVRKGAGEKLKNGETATVLARYTEVNLRGDSIQTSNEPVQRCHTRRNDRYKYAWHIYGLVRIGFDVLVLRRLRALGMAYTFQLCKHRPPVIAR